MHTVLVLICVLRGRWLHTSSVVSCTLARCQSMKVLSSFSSAQLFLRDQPHIRDTL